MKAFALAVCIAALLENTVTCNKPIAASYYRQQLVNHNNPSEGTWSQRYYLDTGNFGGKGYSIFLIPAGNDAIEPSQGILYDFVSDTLSEQLGAVILQPEHRFYGKSQPITDHNVTRWPELLTPQQAMQDTLRLLNYVQTVVLGCSTVSGNREYCPVVTIGAGYAGFLAAMLRYRYPEKIDMSWSSSAPIKLYEQKMKQSDYYERVTKVADEALPGCASNVRMTLNSVAEAVNASSYVTVAQDLGICLDSIPVYIHDDGMFMDELNMIVATKFSVYNREYYPPNHDSNLYKWCTTFSDPTLDVNNRLSIFLNSVLEESTEGIQLCSAFDTPMPINGVNGTISKSDWTRYGTPGDRDPWDFQGCSFLIGPHEFSEKSMFLPRKQSSSWLSNHCQNRFQITPKRQQLVNDLELDKLGEGSKMIFVNGMNDGFYNAGVKLSLNTTIIAINLKNGANGSDLKYTGTFDSGTYDLTTAYEKIFVNLQNWITEAQPLTKKARFMAPFEL